MVGSAVQSRLVRRSPDVLSSARAFLLSSCFNTSFRFVFFGVGFVEGVYGLGRACVESFLIYVVGEVV